MSSMRPRTAIAAMPPSLQPRRAEDTTTSTSKQEKKGTSDQDYFLTAHERAYASGLSDLLATFDSLVSQRRAVRSLIWETCDNQSCRYENAPSRPSPQQASLLSLQQSGCCGGLSATNKKFFDRER